MTAMHPLLAAILAVSCLSAPCRAAPTEMPTSGAPPPGSPAPALAGPLGALEDRSTAATGSDALESLSRGRWARACDIATTVLARQVPDVAALGVFALCAAVNGDRGAAASAIARLREVEQPPYFGLLAQGALQLHDKQAEKAQASWRPVLQARGDDPLGQYFEGEAWHARGRKAEAVSAFRATLKSWPDFAPALTALARLKSGSQASAQDLREALAMAERATRTEPANRGHWQLLADLCRRSGQDGRAEAITLQHLRHPALPALR